MKIDYKGGAGIELKTYLDIPIKYKEKEYIIGRLPIKATIKIKKINGKIYIFAPKKLHSKYSFSFKEMPECHFGVKLFVGKNEIEATKFKLIKNFVENHILKSFAISFTTPSQFRFFIPFPGRSLQPRLCKVRPFDDKKNLPNNKNGGSNINNNNANMSLKGNSQLVNNTPLSQDLSQVLCQINNSLLFVESFLNQIFNYNNWNGIFHKFFFLLF